MVASHAEGHSRLVRASSTRRSEHDVALDRTVAIAVLLALFALYFSIQGGSLISWDGKVMAGVGRNIWEHASLRTFQGSFGVDTGWRPGDPEGWAAYNIGVSVVTVPLWALQLTFAPDRVGFVTLANALVTALAGAVVYLCGIELDWDRTVAVCSALIFGLLTMAVLYSTELFSESGVTLAVIVVLLGLLRWGHAKPEGPLLVGIGVSLAVLFRSDSYAMVVLPAFLLVPAFVPLRRLAESWRHWLPALGWPLGIVTGWTLAFNAVRFGSPLILSYGGVGFTTSFGDGLYRQLLSPGKGFFWYNPILIPALVGVVLLFRRRRAAALAVIVLSLVRAVFYAKWVTPDGSIAWGPRFLLPACALLALGVGELIAWSRSRARRPRIVIRGSIIFLAVVSGIVTVASLWVPYEQQWNRTSDPTTLSASPELATAEIERRQERMYNTWAQSPIRYNLTHLASARRTFFSVGFPLRWWQGGPSVPGVVSLGGAVAFLSFAWWAARRRSRPSLTSFVATQSTPAPRRRRHPDFE